MTNIFNYSDGRQYSAASNGGLSGLSGLSKGSVPGEYKFRIDNILKSFKAGAMSGQEAVKELMKIPGVTNLSKSEGVNIVITFTFEGQNYCAQCKNPESDGGTDTYGASGASDASGFVKPEPNDSKVEDKTKGKDESKGTSGASGTIDPSGVKGKDESKGTSGASGTIDPSGVKGKDETKKKDETQGTSGASDASGAKSTVVQTGTSAASGASGYNRGSLEDIVSRFTHGNMTTKEMDSWLNEHRYTIKNVSRTKESETGMIRYKFTYGNKDYNIACSDEAAKSSTDKIVQQTFLKYNLKEFDEDTINKYFVSVSNYNRVESYALNPKGEFKNLSDLRKFLKEQAAAQNSTGAGEAAPTPEGKDVEPDTVTTQAAEEVAKPAEVVDDSVLTTPVPNGARKIDDVSTIPEELRQFVKKHKNENGETENYFYLTINEYNNFGNLYGQYIFKDNYFTRESNTSKEYVLKDGVELYDIVADAISKKITNSYAVVTTDSWGGGPIRVTQVAGVSTSASTQVRKWGDLYARREIIKNAFEFTEEDKKAYFDNSTLRNNPAYFVSSNLESIVGCISDKLQQAGIDFDVKSFIRQTSISNKDLENPTLDNILSSISEALKGNLDSYIYNKMDTIARNDMLYRNIDDTVEVNNRDVVFNITSTVVARPELVVEKLLNDVPAERRDAITQFLNQFGEDALIYTVGKLKQEGGCKVTADELLEKVAIYAEDFNAKVDGNKSNVTSDSSIKLGDIDVFENIPAGTALSAEQKAAVNSAVYTLLTEKGYDAGTVKYFIENYSASIENLISENMQKGCSLMSIANNIVDSLESTVKLIDDSLKYMAEAANEVIEYIQTHADSVNITEIADNLRKSNSNLRDKDITTIVSVSLYILMEQGGKLDSDSIDSIIKDLFDGKTVDFTNILSGRTTRGGGTYGNSRLAVSDLYDVIDRAVEMVRNSYYNNSKSPSTGNGGGQVAEPSPDGHGEGKYAASPGNDPGKNSGNGGGQTPTSPGSDTYVPNGVTPDEFYGSLYGTNPTPDSEQNGNGGGQTTGGDNGVVPPDYYGQVYGDGETNGTGQTPGLAPGPNVPDSLPDILAPDGSTTPSLAPDMTPDVPDSLPGITSPEGGTVPNFAPDPYVPDSLPDILAPDGSTAPDLAPGPNVPDTLPDILPPPRTSNPYGDNNFSDDKRTGYPSDGDNREPGVNKGGDDNNGYGGPSTNDSSYYPEGFNSVEEFLEALAKGYNTPDGMDVNGCINYIFMNYCGPNSEITLNGIDKVELKWDEYIESVKKMMQMQGAKSTEINSVVEGLESDKQAATGQKIEITYDMVASLFANSFDFTDPDAIEEALKKPIATITLLVPKGETKVICQRQNADDNSWVWTGSFADDMQKITVQISLDGTMYLDGEVVESLPV